MRDRDGAWRCVLVAESRIASRVAVGKCGGGVALSLIHVGEGQAAAAVVRGC